MVLVDDLGDLLRRSAARHGAVTAGRGSGGGGHRELVPPPPAASPQRRRRRRLPLPYSRLTPAASALARRYPRGCRASGSRRLRAGATRAAVLPRGGKDRGWAARPTATADCGCANTLLLLPGPSCLLQPWLVAAGCSSRRGPRSVLRVWPIEAQNSVYGRQRQIFSHNQKRTVRAVLN